PQRIVASTQDCVSQNHRRALTVDPQSPPQILAVEQELGSRTSNAMGTTLARRKMMVEALEEQDVGAEDANEFDDEHLNDDGGEPLPQDTLVCALTGEFKPDKPEERTLQSLIEQLHREYRVELADMERNVKVSCLDAAGKKKTIT